VVQRRVFARPIGNFLDGMLYSSVRRFVPPLDRGGRNAGCV
jgi:hypothetical protein